MKMFVRLAVLLILFCCAGSSQAQADVVGTTTDHLNLRAGSGTNHPDIGGIAADVRLVVVPHD